MVRKPRLRVAIAAATVTTMLLGSVVTANAAVPTDTSELREAVTADAIMGHLAELQKIADNNGGTRASGTPGYDRFDRIHRGHARRGRLRGDPAELPVQLVP